ncbi:unnamed protein product [Arctia plantaginis]|uniref:ABC-type glutathione-S-conjugate transporter n=1 Tax=Arctia plantaginis TaxID=874455 RepID=A0A8S0YVS7_ARCPL|nr:unnamed protein product [Arctia plantaginis]CAB3247545.1 unnamed protein product [Arctia plantaginis]
MDYFCGSPLWNTTFVWDTDDPNFTPCFQKTVLVWIPCGYLWLAALLELYQMFVSKEANIPWSKLNVIKLVITLFLVLLQIINFSQVIYTSSREQDIVFDADYYAPIVKLITFVLSATILVYNKKCGMRASGVLFVFWLLLILAGLPQLRTEITKYKAAVNNDLYSLGSYIVYYILVMVMFVMNCFADLPPTDTPYVYDKRKSPEDASGVPSRLTFSWFDPVAITGYRRTLTEDDLYSLSPKLLSKETVPRFDKYWKRALKKQWSRTEEPSSSETSSLKGGKKEKNIVSILPVLIRAFGGQFFVAMVLKLCNDLLLFAAPVLLRLLVGFVEGNEPVWRGYLYAVGMLVCASLQTVFLGQNMIMTSKVGVKINCALSSMLYKKALNLTNKARKKHTVGEIMNLMSTDVTRFTDLTLMHLIWSAPLQVALAMYFLWNVLGISVLAGLGVIICLTPVNGFFAGIQEKFQAKIMYHKDERIKLMTEVLNGMKVLKMYAWETSFQEHLLKIRNKELSILKKMVYFNSITAFLWFSTPFLVSLMTFGCYVLINDTEVLDSKKAFVALSLFNILRYPMTILPNVLSNAIQLCVSIKRLNKFMNSDELDTSMIEHNPNEPDQILVENGHFSWGPDETPVLKNLNIHVPQGSLVAVVGPVGSGKSSLLCAILGEMDKVSGRVNVKGEIAYVSQQAWIQNATVQNNILFDKPLNKSKYNKILEACALKTDLTILPGGDQTEIGEKGINLSGGQKQRMSLARAVYYDADNYFLDDPLSAVDSHVGKHLFDQVIGPNGVLKNKTRLWVTHNLSYLAQTDLVLVLNDGQICEAGKYHELLERKGAFADFLMHHLSNAEQTDENLEAKVQSEKQLIQSLSSGDLKSQRSESGDHKQKLKKEHEDENDVENEYDQLIEAEKAESGSVKWAVYKHYLLNVGMLAVVGTPITYGLIHGLQIGANFWLVRWSNDKNMLVNGTVDTELRDMYLGVYGGIGLVHVIVSICADLLPYLACWKAAKILHETLLKNLLRAPLNFFEVTPVGRIITRFSKDVDSVDSTIPLQIANAINFSFEVIGVLLVICYSTPMFTAVIIPIGILYYCIQRFYVPTSRQLMRIMAVARSPIFSHFNESILGCTSIRAFGVKDRFIAESQGKVDYFQSFSYLRFVADRWLGVRLQIVGSLIIFFAALFVVISRDGISPGLAGLSVSYTLEITQTLGFLVNATSIIETEIVAVERMKEYAETEQEAEWIKAKGPHPSWPEKGAIEFEGLTMAYRNGAEPVLHNITCTVGPGDKIGVVGRTGAGKSTLTLALFRIMEAVAGRILIDGLDIAEMGLHQLRSRISIIPQDPVLFSGSLRMNLDPFESYSDNEIWSILEHAHLKSFVKSLPARLQYEVLEGGANLSLGQRQLVCLARALLRKTPLLVLDEATAAVDLETDELIQKTIRSEFASCTVITVAHRLNTILDSTKVMVLDKGHLIEYAPPDKLLQDKNSMFYSLAKDARLV